MIEPYTQTQIEQQPFEAPMFQMGSTMVQMTNPDKIMDDMELTLRSMVKDSHGNHHKIGEPLMNDLGIISVKGQVQSIVNQSTVMSNFNKHDIPMLVDYLGDTLALDLMVNREKYGMTYTTRSKVYYIALSTAYVCMKRALDEGEKRFWKGSQREITNKVEGSNRPGGIKRLFGWGRN